MFFFLRRWLEHEISVSRRLHLPSTPCRIQPAFSNVLKKKMELWVAGGGPMSVFWRQTHGQDHGPVWPTNLEAWHIQAETWRITCTCTQIAIAQVAKNSASQLAPRRTIKNYDDRCSTLTVRHPPNKMHQMCCAYYCRPMIAEHILRICWREWIPCSTSFDAEVAHRCHQL